VLINNDKDHLINNLPKKLIDQYTKADCLIGAEYDRKLKELY